MSELVIPISSDTEMVINDEQILLELAMECEADELPDYELNAEAQEEREILREFGYYAKLA